MPSEILQLVFLQVQALTLQGVDTHSVKGLSTRLAQAVPMTLASVCLRWRRIVQDTPRMLRYVHLSVKEDLDPSEIDRYSKHLEDVRLRCNSPCILFELHLALGPDLSRDDRFEELFLQVFCILEQARHVREIGAFLPSFGLLLSPLDFSYLSRLLFINFPWSRLRWSGGHVAHLFHA